MAIAAGVAFFAGQRFESLNTLQVEKAYAEYQKQIALDYAEKLEKADGQRKALERQLAAETGKLAEETQRVAALRHDLASTRGRFVAGMQRKTAEAIATAALSADPAAAGVSDIAAAEQVLSGTPAGAALSLIPEADEYLLRLRECRAWADSVQRLLKPQEN